MCPGFQSFFRFLQPFVLTKCVSNTIRVNKTKNLFDLCFSSGIALNLEQWKRFKAQFEEIDEAVKSFE